MKVTPRQTVNNRKAMGLLFSIVFFSAKAIGLCLQKRQVVMHKLYDISLHMSLILFKTMTLSTQKGPA